MAYTFPTLRLAALATALVCGPVTSQAQDRQIYKCVDSAGTVVFSDKECVGNTAKLSIKTPTDEELAARKADRDAKTVRDAALANQVQSNRLSNEQAARAAQDQQMQTNKALADKFEQERNQRNATVVSAPNVSQSTPLTTAP